jgi:UDP-2,4-diacetamido-2,4,6-trideoxy-beta-L-altropyranose hydrolase
MSYGVTFWTEGGKTIGMGHLSRSVNIARALKRNSVPFDFLINDDESVKARLEAEGFEFRVVGLSPEGVQKISSGTVVIDTKKDLSGLAALLKERGKRVVVIDNASSAEADLSVYPSPFYRGERRANERGGSDYLIIGDNFIRERGALAQVKPFKPFKVLITMGGADPFNLTEQVVNAIERLDGVEATVVIGPASKPTQFLKRFIESGSEKFRFLYNVADMAPVMSSCHIAFTAVGTTVYELAYLGVPSVVIANYPNDDSDLRELKELGISFGLGYYKDVNAPMIRGAVKSLMKRENLLELMSRKAHALTDGRGAFRIASCIAELAEESGDRVKRIQIDEVSHA